MGRSIVQLMVLTLLFSYSLSEFLVTEFFMTNLCPKGKVKRVSNIARTNYDHQATLTYWTLYPGLQLRVIIPFEQFVSITYSIGYQSGGNPLCYFTTRVLVNNVDTIVHRNDINTQFSHYVDKTKEVLLKAGVHSIRVEYRTGCQPHIQANWDWNGYYLQTVHYDCVQKQECK